MLKIIWNFFIYSHNLHHLMHFFATIHNCILNDNLNELISLIEEQGGTNAVQYRLEPNTKVISRVGVGKGFADARA